MAAGGQQSNSRDEYERKIAADIQSRRVEAEPQDADEIIAEGPEDEELEDDELAPTESGGEETPQEPTKPSQIPKYEAESPKEYVPGGEAKVVKGEPPAGAEAEAPRRGFSGVYDGAKQKVADAKNQAVEWAKEQLKKFAWEAIKKTAATAVKAAGAFLAEGGWVPVLIILIIVGLTIAAFALWPNRSLGSTITQQTDILGDRPWISKILGLANDPNMADKLEASLSELETGLTQLEADMQNPPLSNLDAATKQKISAKIAEVRQGIAEFRQIPATDAKARTASAQKIITAVSQLVDLFAAAPCHFNGPTAYPVKPGDNKWPITGFNNTLHGATPQSTGRDPGHETFVNTGKRTNDAVDINGRLGTPVYAAFGGKVGWRDFINSSEYKQVLFISGQDSSGVTYYAVYAHLRNVPNNLRGNGATVTAGQFIGEFGPLNSPHLHFELQCGKQPVTTTREDMADYYGGNRKHSQRGNYLYDRILNVLNKALPGR